MADILITIEKSGYSGATFHRWSNSYAAGVAGDGLDGVEARNLALNLLMFENHLHLPHVAFDRVCIRTLPYQTGDAGSFRVFMPPGRGNGLRTPSGDGQALPWGWTFTIKKQTAFGRSGHAAYHGVLTSCDISVNSNNRLVLRSDSELCGQRMQEARYIMLNQEQLLLVPGATADFALDGLQRSVNFLSQGSVTYLHGLAVRTKYTKPECIVFRNDVVSLFESVALAMVALQEPPETIADEYLIDPIRWTFDAFAAVELGAKILREKLLEIGVPPYGVEDEGKCHFAAKTMDKVGALHVAEFNAQIWIQPGSAGRLFLKLPGSTRPKSDLADVLAEARPIVAALDEFRSAVAFNKPDTLLIPPVLAVAVPGLAWLDTFEPCDAATAAWLDKRTR